MYAEYGAKLGQDFVKENLSTLARLIEQYARGKPRELDSRCWVLWDLLIEYAEAEPGLEENDDAGAAFLSPIGHLAEALLLSLGEKSPNVYEELPAVLRGRLERLLNGTQAAHRNARLVLAQAIAWLHRLKPDLVVPSFLRRFDWADKSEARAMWLGYLIAPKITPAFWLAIRPLLLETFSHSAVLGEAETNLYSFFAFILLNADVPLASSGARRALKEATPTGRSHVAWFWCRQADSATEHGAALYRERFKNLLTNVWPMEKEFREPSSSENLAQLAIACASEFPNAVPVVLPLLTHLEEPVYVLYILKNKTHSEQFPEATLALLDAIIGDSTGISGALELREILDQLVRAAPALGPDPRFSRLQMLLKKFE